jgi:hypothetical protein
LEIFGQMYVVVAVLVHYLSIPQRTGDSLAWITWDRRRYVISLTTCWLGRWSSNFKPTFKL